MRMAFIVFIYVYFLHIGIIDMVVEDPACPWNNYRVTSEDGFVSCRKCRQCPPGYQIAKPCGKTTDTECEPCPHRTFNPGNLTTCQKCARCHAGHHVYERCRPNKDTECRKCPPFMYSSQKNNRYCYSCSSCRLNQEVLANCSSRGDTRCGACLRDYFKDVTTGECRPCSRCPLNQPSLIVEECLRKLGHSNHICRPSNYGFLDITDNDSPDVYKNQGYEEYNQHIKFTDSFYLSVYALGVVLVFSIMFVVVIVIVRERRVLRLLRKCRDFKFCEICEDTPNVHADDRIRDEETAHGQETSTRSMAPVMVHECLKCDNKISAITHQEDKYTGDNSDTPEDSWSYGSTTTYKKWLTERKLPQDWNTQTRSFPIIAPIKQSGNELSESTNHRNGAAIKRNEPFRTVYEYISHTL